MIELAVVAVIIGLLAFLVLPALLDSKTDSRNKAAEASAKTMNEAILRAKLKNDTSPLLVGSNATNVRAAALYLQAQGYLR